MHKTIYISLPITGHEDSYQRRCEAAKTQVKNNFPGAYIITPDCIAAIVTSGKPHGSLPPEGEYLGADIEAIVDRSTDVFFCEGWEASKGCTVEMAAARAYGKNILFQKHFE